MNLLPHCVVELADDVARRHVVEVEWQVFDPLGQLRLQPGRRADFLADRGDALLVGLRAVLSWSSAAWSSSASSSARSGRPAARALVFRSVIDPIELPLAAMATWGRFHHGERRFESFCLRLEKR